MGRYHRCLGAVHATFRHVAPAIASILVTLTALFPTFAYADGICHRVSGATRYDTMSSLVSGVGGWGSSDAVILASGANYPDALAASAYAGSLDAPIVLTDPGSLSVQAADLIRALRPSRVFVVGGPGAVSDATVRYAGSIAGSSCTRLSGDTRYDTSVAIMEALDADSDTVIIATGSNYADSLSISPFAFATRSPILLCDPSSGLTQRAVDAIRGRGFSRAILVGGSNAVPDEVVWQLKSAGVPVDGIRRLSGDTRYDTSNQIANFEISETSLFSVGNLGFATGSNFADALAMGPCMGHRGSPLLLVDDGAQTVCGYAQRFRGKVGTAYVAGGENAVSSHDFAAIEAALTPGSSGTGTDPVEPSRRTVAVPSPASLVYSGSRQAALSDTSDYTVRSGSATDAGSYTATLSLRDRSGCVWASTGSSDDIYVNWSISPADISNARVSIPSQSFSGSELTPGVKVELGGRTLSAGRDYSVAYADNVHVGTARATVSGLLNYTGSASAAFSISPADISNANVEVPDQRYTGSPLTPEPRVTLDGVVLTKDTDYSVSYSHNTNIGKASVVIRGKGDYTGSVNGSFNITRGHASTSRVKIGEVTVTVYTYSDGYSYVDIPSGNVSINSCVNKVRALEVKDCSKSEDANVEIWDNNGLTSQIWNFVKVSDGVYRIENAYSNKVLGVSNDDIANKGANVVQQSWNDRDGQKWRAVVYDNKLMLLNQESGLALDCDGGYADCGTNMQLWTKNNSNAQLFELRSEQIISKGTKTLYINNVCVTQTADDTGNRYYEVPEGTYIIQSCAGSNQVLDLYWGNKDNGTNVETWQDNGGNGQKWKFVRAGNGIYKIYSVASDKCLEVAGQDSNTNGGNVQQWDYADGWSNKLWKLWLTKDNKLMFLNLASFRALNVSGGTAGNGVNVNVLDRDMSNAQAWTLRSTTKKIDPNEECRAMENEIWTAYCNYRRDNGLSVPYRDGGCNSMALESAQHSADIGKLEHIISTKYPGYSDVLQYASYRMDGQTAVNKWINSPKHKAQLNCRTVTKAGVGVVYKNGCYYMSITYNYTGTNVG